MLREQIDSNQVSLVTPGLTSGHHVAVITLTLHLHVLTAQFISRLAAI